MSKWYKMGYSEAKKGLNCDPPMRPGHRSYEDYVEGYRDGENELQRAEAG